MQNLIIWVQVGTLFVLTITFIVFVFGLFLAKKQIKAITTSAKATNFFYLISYLQSEKVREARELVHKLEGQHYNSWKQDPDKTKAAQLVASSFDITAVVMKAELINIHIFSTPWKTAICSTYDILKDYVKDRQTKTNDNNYLAHYVGLVHFLQDKPIPVDGPCGVQF